MRNVINLRWCQLEDTWPQPFPKWPQFCKFEVPTGRKVILASITAKWMWDRSIFSSKFPMHDNNDLRVCKICKRKCEHEIVIVTKIQTDQFQVCRCVCKSYKTPKWSNKLSYYFGKNEENMGLSHTVLDVKWIADYFFTAGN